MSKPTKEHTAEMSEARSALLRTAATLFAQQGYSATGVQQITDAAGVNKAMLYYYFSSKDGLYDQLVMEGIASVEAAVSVAETMPGPIRARLQQFITQYIAIVVEQPDLARILFREVMGGGERDRQPVIDHFSNIFLRLSELLSASEDTGELRAMDTGVLAYSLFGMATMFIAGHFVAGRALDVPVIAEHIVEIFLNGAGME